MLELRFITTVMIYWANNIRTLRRTLAVKFISILVVAQLAMAADQEAESNVNSLGKISPAPTEISSDTMDFDVETRTAIFSGNVRVVDERLSLTSEEMIVQFDENNKLQKIDATGKVVIDYSGNIAKSGKAVYDFKEGRVVLSINPVLMQGDNRVVGAEKIIFSRETEKFTTEGGAPHIIFYETDGQSKFPDLFNQAGEKEGI